MTSASRSKGEDVPPDFGRVPSEPGSRESSPDGLDPSGFDPSRKALALFVRESNWIEGIQRDPTANEIAAHERLLSKSVIDISDMVDFVEAVQPGARLRDRKGLNVYVGDHVPPSGGYGIALALCDILGRAGDPYLTHVEYETLHPFTDGNGRSGRALWLRTMGGIGSAPLGFLHHWYYQSLSGSGYRGKADTLPCDSDGSGEAGKTGTGLTEGNSADPKGIAPTVSHLTDQEGQNQ